MTRPRALQTTLAMALMLCGQVVAGAMMWCCNPAGADVAAHVDQSHQSHHFHQLHHAGAAVTSGEASDADVHAGQVSAHAPDATHHHHMMAHTDVVPDSPENAHGDVMHDCEHQCVSCAGGTAPALVPPLLVASSPLATLVTFAPSRWLDAEPSLPFRPPISG